jgi:hypothetical protein
MLAFLLIIALATSMTVGVTQTHASRVHVSPACQINQDPQGGCAQ